MKFQVIELFGEVIRVFCNENDASNFDDEYSTDTGNFVYVEFDESE